MYCIKKNGMYYEGGGFDKYVQLTENPSSALTFNEESSASAIAEAINGTVETFEKKTN